MGRGTRKSKAPEGAPTGPSANRGMVYDDKAHEHVTEEELKRRNQNRALKDVPYLGSYVNHLTRQQKQSAPSGMTASIRPAALAAPPTIKGPTTSSQTFQMDRGTQRGSSNTFSSGSATPGPVKVIATAPVGATKLAAESVSQLKDSASGMSLVNNLNGSIINC